MAVVQTGDFCYRVTEACWCTADFAEGRVRPNLARQCGTESESDLQGEWGVFFTTIASIAGAVLALLFVGLGLKVEQWQRSLLDRIKGTLTVGEVAAPLLIGLAAILPPNGLMHTAAVFVGLVGLALAVALIVAYRRRGAARSSWDRTDMVLTSVVTVPVMAAILCCGLVGPGSFGQWTMGRTAVDGTIYLIGAFCVWLILSGTFQAWVLLTAPESKFVRHVDFRFTSAAGISPAELEQRVEAEARRWAAGNSRCRDARVIGTTGLDTGDLEHRARATVLLDDV